MSAVIDEKWIGDIRWLVATGARDDVFRALGEHARSEIESVVMGLSELASLRSSVSDGPLSEAFRGIVDASRSEFPVEFGELEALAEGSGVDVDDLLVLTLRGDLEGHDDLGCSELGWTNGVRALLGHNEDGHFRLEGACSLLTLRIDGEPAILTWWYPGFLPGNTYTLNEYGLVWGVDTIHMACAQIAAGRAFVARGLQSVATLDGIVEYLRSHPAAGAFAYVAGQMGAAKLLSVEQAGDQVAARESLQDQGCLWHTNHLCDLPEEFNRPSLDSLTRGAVLNEMTSAPEEPSVSWLLEILTGATPPLGVRADGTDITLCTFVADFAERTITLLQRGSVAITVSAEDLLNGKSELASNQFVGSKNDSHRDLPGETHDN